MFVIFVPNGGWGRSTAMVPLSPYTTDLEINTNTLPHEMAILPGLGAAPGTGGRTGKEPDL